MRGLMMDAPLQISALLDHAARQHGEREIVSRTVEGPTHRYTYADAASRSRRLAKVLKGMGVSTGDRVATLAWNNHRHLELYYAISGIGAICHTINPRLSLEQLAYIINHAEDRLLFFDLNFLPIVEKIKDQVPSVRQFVVMSDRSQIADSESEWLTAYEDILADEPNEIDWPTFDENTAAGLCYTSGTTGNPKGVLYSHRSTILHAYASAAPDALGFRERDAVLPVVPMFHVNAWGVPHVAPMCGAKLVLPGPALDGASLSDLINSEGVTVAAGVPTIWHGLLQHLESSGERIDSVERVFVGGSALPESMIRAFESGYGVTAIQGWGMTETSPIGTVGTLKSRMTELPDDEQFALKAKQGHALFGFEMKVADEAENSQPWDGQAAGELLVRGPWVTKGYFGEDNTKVLRGGWFPTGDVATVDEDGYLQITDRSKDLIKSGGEWISSVDLENAAMAHADVAQAAAIGIVDSKWGERPILIVVPKEGKQPASENILSFLTSRVEKWWLPDKVILAESLPIGATGKILKTRLREIYGREQKTSA